MQKAFVLTSSSGISQRARDWNLEFQSVYDSDAFEGTRSAVRDDLMRSLEAELIAFLSRVARTIVEARMLEPPRDEATAWSQDESSAAAASSLGTKSPDGSVSQGQKADLPSPMKPPTRGPPRRTLTMKMTAPTPSSEDSTTAAPLELPGHPNCFRVGNVFVRMWANGRQAKHFVHALNVAMLAGHPALHVPLTALVSYCGITFTAQALIPLATTPTVVYRGDGQPDPAPVNVLVHAAVRIVTDTANCLVDAAHGGEQHKLPGFEVMEGLDGRFYITIATGLLPHAQPDVDSSPIRRFESLTIVDVPAAPNADRSHATEMGMVLLFRAITSITLKPEAERQKGLIEAMRKNGLNVAYLGVAANLIPDEDSLSIDERAAALTVLSVEMLARAVKSLLYVELETMFQARAIERLHIPVSNALELITTDDEKRAKKRLIPVIARKFFQNKRLSSSSPVHQAIMSARVSKRRQIIDRLKETANLTFGDAVVSRSLLLPVVNQQDGGDNANDDAQQQKAADKDNQDDASPPVVEMDVITHRVCLLSKIGDQGDEATLKAIVCPPRLFSFGLPRVVNLMLRRGDYNEAQSQANAALADRKQRYGRQSLQYALASIPVAVTQVLVGRTEGGTTLYHEALISMHKMSRERAVGSLGVLLRVIADCMTLGTVLQYAGKYAQAFAQFRKAADLLEEATGEWPENAAHFGVYFVNTIFNAIECIRLNRIGSTTSPSAGTTACDDDSQPSQTASRQGSVRVAPARIGSGSGNSGSGFGTSSTVQQQQQAAQPPAALTQTTSGSASPISTLNRLQKSSGGRAGGANNNNTNNLTTSMTGGAAAVSPREQNISYSRWLITAACSMVRVVTPDDGVFRVSMLLGEGLMGEDLESDAAVMFERAITVALAVHGRASEEHAAALAATALALSKTDFETYAPRCEQLLSQHVDTCKAVYGAQSPSTAGALNNMGSLLMMLGKLDSAEACFKEADEAYAAVGFAPGEEGRGVCRRNFAVLMARRAARSAFTLQSWFRRRARRKLREAEERAEAEQRAQEGDSAAEASVATTTPPAAAASDSTTPTTSVKTVRRKSVTDTSAAASNSTQAQRTDERVAGGNSTPPAVAAQPGQQAPGQGSKPPKTAPKQQQQQQQQPEPADNASTSASHTRDDDSPKHASAEPAESSKQHQQQESPAPDEKTKPDESSSRAEPAASSSSDRRPAPRDGQQATAPAASPAAAKTPSRTGSGSSSSQKTRSAATTSDQHASSPPSGGKPTSGARPASSSGTKAKGSGDAATKKEAKDSSHQQQQASAGAASKSRTSSAGKPPAPAADKQSQQQAQPTPPAAARSEAAAPARTGSGARKQQPQQKQQPADSATSTVQGKMPLDRAVATLQRVSRAFVARRLLRTDAARVAREAEAADARRRAAAEAEAARRERSAILLQKALRAHTSTLARAMRVAGTLCRIAAGMRGRVGLATLAWNRALHRLKVATGKINDAEASGRQAIVAEERQASKQNFEQLMTIRRLARGERQRRLERLENIRVFQQRRDNLEDDERGHRHAVQNEATYVAAQLQRGIRDRLRRALAEDKRRREAAEKEEEERAAEERRRQRLESHALPPLSGGGGGGSHRAGSGKRGSTSRRSSGGSKRPSDAFASTTTSAHDDDTGAAPLRLEDLNGSTASTKDTTSPKKSDRAMVEEGGQHRRDEPVERFEGFVVDEAFRSILDARAHALRLRATLAERLDQLTDDVEAIREERNRQQAALIEEATSPQSQSQGGFRAPSLAAKAPQPPRGSKPLRAGLSRSYTQQGASSSARGAGRPTSPSQQRPASQRSPRGQRLPLVSSPPANASTRRQAAAADALRQLGMSTSAVAKLAVAGLPEVQGYAQPADPSPRRTAIETSRATHVTDMYAYLRPTRRGASTQPRQ